LSALEFKKIKDAEVAWLDSKIAQKEVEDLVHADDVAMSGMLCNLLLISLCLSHFILFFQKQSWVKKFRLWSL
jgi:hypothetical protein